MNGIVRSGLPLLVAIITTILAPPSAAQTLSPRESILVGGGMAKRWIASAAGGNGGFAFTAITFFSDRTFLAELGGKQTIGRWGLSEDEKLIHLHGLASGNWKSPDTVTYEIGTIGTSGFSAIRIDPTGGRQAVRFRAEGSAPEQSTRKARKRQDSPK